VRGSKYPIVLAWSLSSCRSALTVLLRVAWCSRIIAQGLGGPGARFSCSNIQALVDPAPLGLPRLHPGNYVEGISNDGRIPTKFLIVCEQALSLGHVSLVVL